MNVPLHVELGSFGSYSVDRDTAVAAVATCLAHDAEDILPMLFAPLNAGGKCPTCHWNITSSRHHSPSCPKRQAS